MNGNLPKNANDNKLLSRSHSLGTLIEWKPEAEAEAEAKKLLKGSHSLGTLIEWKLESVDTDPLTGYRVPTRWGH